MVTAFLSYPLKESVLSFSLFHFIYTFICVYICTNDVYLCIYICTPIHISTSVLYHSLSTLSSVQVFPLYITQTTTHQAQDMEMC